jgi:hypothetical protein
MSCSFSRSLMVESRAMFCATSSRLLTSVWVVAPPHLDLAAARWAIQSQNSSTLLQRAAATDSLSSLSYRCCS